MPRKTFSFLFVFSLIFLALAVTLNRASADLGNDQFVLYEKASPNPLWSDVDPAFLETNNAAREIFPVSFRALRLNLFELKNVLRRTPLEFTEAARKIHIEITLPAEYKRTVTGRTIRHERRLECSRSLRSIIRCLDN